ncbi:MAG: hypothetical protein WCS42_22095, partial [Verrucomicrobiota bacterium]
MSANQQTPIFSASPVYWPDGVECQFNQLNEVIRRAKQDGFIPVRMTVIRGGYSLKFQRASADKQPAAVSALNGQPHFPDDELPLQPVVGCSCGSCQQ